MNKLRKDNGSKLSRLGGQKIIVILVVIFLALFFSIMSPSFRKYTTLVSMLDYSYYIALMAIGVTFPLITGGVDLSIGTGLICYSLTGGFLVTKLGLPTGVGMVACVLMGTLFGALNGWLVAWLNLPPFLVTLSTCMVTRGLGSIVVSGFGTTWPAVTQDGGWFRNIFKITIENNVKIPLGIIWIILITLLMSFVLNHTKVGRYIKAVGSNKQAAHLSGVNVKIYHALAYVISGTFAGLAGLAYAAIFSTILPGTGAGFELEAIGGAIIGGVSTTGGAGSIGGTLLGVFVICLLKTGLPFIGLEANWQQIITGLVLIGAVMIDVLKKLQKK